jgi:3-deoxy-manno-octulosonate cytidylyltransferase (CMP-KDO synthetase)
MDTFEKLSACVIIPARYRSSRFPGKPLVRLLDKPMIEWVAGRAAKAVGIDHVYVATDDPKIAKVVEVAGYKAIMTSPNTLTGTDRVAEAAEKLTYDIFINVQGDEPLVNPSDILNIIKQKRISRDAVINGFTQILEPESPDNENIPKTVFNGDGHLIYMSRSKVPGKKSDSKLSITYCKQVCIYAYSIDELRKFNRYGRKSELEEVEDIEILRFLELGITVRMVACTAGSAAVDVPGDVEKVEEILRKQRPNT